MSRFGLPLAAVLVVGFYIGIQFGLPFWESSFFAEGRTYQLMTPVADHSCSSADNLFCSGEIVFDAGGRVLLIEVGQGKTGTYFLKGGELHLVFSQLQGRQEIIFKISPNQNQLVEKSTGRLWARQVNRDQTDS